MTDVPLDEKGAEQIPPCQAFGGYTNCRNCGHHWKDHQHVKIEYSERTEITTDPTVQNALDQNKDAASTKQIQIAALQTRIKELQEEHQMIQASQARFSHYLAQHSITYYNDATIEYYEHLIKDERSKVSRGAPRTRLKQLEDDKASYEYFVNAMKKGKQTAAGGPLDEHGVHALVQRLYGMKHYGKNLKDCAKATGQAYAATFRERPYRIRGRSGLGSYSPSPNGSRMSVTSSQQSSNTANLNKGGTSLRLPYQLPPSMSNKLIKTSQPRTTEVTSFKGRFQRSPPQPTGNWTSNNLYSSGYDDDNWSGGDNGYGSGFQPPDMVTQRPAAQNGVRTNFFDEDNAHTTPYQNHQAVRNGNGASGSSNPTGSSQRAFSGNEGLYGHGYAVPVMLKPDDPDQQYGPQDLKKKSWMSNIKNKMKGKN